MSKERKGCAIDIKSWFQPLAQQNNNNNDDINLLPKVRR